MAISLVGIAILIGLSRLVFGSVKITLTQDLAAERLAFDEPDFSPVVWLIDQKTGAGLARNEAGEIALILTQGDGLATRRFAPETLNLSYQDGYLKVDRVDHTTRAAQLAATDEEASLWIGKSVV